MTLDPGLRRKDLPGNMLCTDIFEHRLLVGGCVECHPERSEGSKVPGTMVLTLLAMV